MEILVFESTTFFQRCLFKPRERLPEKGPSPSTLFGLRKCKQNIEAARIRSGGVIEEQARRGTEQEVRVLRYAHFLFALKVYLCPPHFPVLCTEVVPCGVAFCDIIQRQECWW